MVDGDARASGFFEEREEFIGHENLVHPALTAHLAPRRVLLAGCLLMLLTGAGFAATSVFGLLLLIADVWAIVCIVQSAAGTAAKVLWIVLILLLPCLALTFYYAQMAVPVGEEKAS